MKCVLNLNRIVVCYSVPSAPKGSVAPVQPHQCSLRHTHTQRVSSSPAVDQSPFTRACCNKRYCDVARQVAGRRQSPGPRTLSRVRATDIICHSTHTVCHTVTLKRSRCIANKADHFKCQAARLSVQYAWIPSLPVLVLHAAAHLPAISTAPRASMAWSFVKLQE